MHTGTVSNVVIVDRRFLDEMLEALKQADLQIEYMQQKFKETGTGNSVRAQLQNVLAKAKVKP